MKTQIKQFLIQQIKLFLAKQINLPLKLHVDKKLEKIKVFIKNNNIEESRNIFLPVELYFIYEELVEQMDCLIEVNLDEPMNGLRIVHSVCRVNEKYDVDAALEYSNHYWNKRNPTYPAFEDNCTNYVSQCLLAGGMKMVLSKNRSNGWWYESSASYSYSWTVSNALYQYLLNKRNGIRGRRVYTAKELGAGDLLFISFKGDIITHSAIVVDKNINGEPLVNANTTDSYYRLWTYINSPSYTNNVKYYFIKIVDDEKE